MIDRAVMLLCIVLQHTPGSPVLSWKCLRTCEAARSSIEVAMERVESGRAAVPPSPTPPDFHLQISLRLCKPSKTSAAMPSKLAKVQKHVTKKKGNKIHSLHENSRDALRLRKAGARDDRVSRLTRVHKKANRHWLDRVYFFQDRLPETLHPMETEQIQAAVQEYLGRDAEELEQLKAERRAGRPPTTRQTLLEQQREVERQEYESGFWLPNMQDGETLVKLDAWNGDWLGLGVMRFMRVDAKGGVKESQFPPRGAS